MSSLSKLINLLEQLTNRQVHLIEASAVAIVLKDNQILLGTAVNSNDDREGKLCFVGGGIDEGETPYQAAKREAWEEAGIFSKCAPIDPVVDPDLPKVHFVLCHYLCGKLQPNEEFSDMNWYSLQGLPLDRVYPQNIKILKTLGLL